MVDMLEEGRFPENDSEVLLNQNAGSILNCSIGDPVTVQTPAGDFHYTVCGFAADTSNSLSDGACFAVLRYPAFEALAEANGQQREMQFYIQFQKSFGIKNTIARLKTEHGWSEDNLSENSAVLGIMGMSSNNYIVGLYGVAAVLGVIVIIAGVLMISGSMSTEVARRTEYFGMLRCIGASKRQIRRLVRREAFCALRYAIPFGVAASVFACWGVCAVMAYGIGGEWAGMPVGRNSAVGIILGILVGCLTVLLAAASPAKRASKVSPMAAVSGDGVVENRGTAWKRDCLPIPVSLGIHHMVSRKKNLILMTGSFALSIVLFLSFSVMITWINNALTTTKPYSPDLSIYADDYSPCLPRSLADSLRNTDGVRYVYGRMHVRTDIENCAKADCVDLISYDDLQFRWAEKDRIRGSIDAVKNGTGDVLVVFEKGNRLDLGDTFTVNGKPLKVAAVLSDSPFSSTDIPTVICSESTFEEVIGKKDYSVLDLQLQGKNTDEPVAKLRKRLPEGLIFSDRRAAKTETNSTYLAFTLLVYSFLALIAMIAVCNIVNSISMSVSSRRKQYGMMRAIGLDRNQLTRMITAESLGYGLSGCIAGCIFGVPLHAWFYRIAVTGYWGIPWAFPLKQMLIIAGVVLCSALAAVYGPVKSLQSRSIIETINS